MGVVEQHHSIVQITLQEHLVLATLHQHLSTIVQHSMVNPMDHAPELPVGIVKVILLDQNAVALLKLHLLIIVQQHSIIKH